MNKAFVAAALGITVLASGAMAQDQGAPRGPRGGGMGLMGADANGDGIITREEMLAQVDKRFAGMDTNHDGKIDQAERDATRSGQGRGFGRRHADSDGALSLDEEHARANKRFDMLDTNHDGKIDQAERDAMRQRMMDMRSHAAPSAQPTPASPPDAPQGN